jgi:hypothetical protein
MLLISFVSSIKAVSLPTTVLFIFISMKVNKRFKVFIFAFKFYFSDSSAVEALENSKAIIETMNLVKE